MGCWTEGDTRYPLSCRLVIMRSDSLKPQNSNQEPFMGVKALAGLNTSLKSIFSGNAIKHIILYSTYVSRILEVKNSVHRINLVKEVTRIFESALEENMKVDNKIPYKAIPLLATGSCSANLKIVPGGRPEESFVKINGELINLDNPAMIKAKMQKIYERGCNHLKLPDNLSYSAILVDLYLTKARHFSCSSGFLQRFS